MKEVSVNDCDNHVCLDIELDTFDISRVSYGYSVFMVLLVTIVGDMARKLKNDSDLFSKPRYI